MLKQIKQTGEAKTSYEFTSLFATKNIIAQNRPSTFAQFSYRVIIA
jgi:hypothetical protein